MGTGITLWVWDNGNIPCDPGMWLGGSRGGIGVGVTLCVLVLLNECEMVAVIRLCGSQWPGIAILLRGRKRVNITDPRNRLLLETPQSTSMILWVVRNTKPLLRLFPFEISHWTSTNPLNRPL